MKAKPKPKPLETLADVARFMRENFPEAQVFPDPRAAAMAERADYSPGRGDGI